MISANGGLSAHRYTPQVTQRWPRGSEPASLLLFVPTKAGRNFAQLSSHCEFGILQPCLIPAGQQFVFLNLGSINLI